MRIIRFIDQNGQTQLGLEEGADRARRLEGSLFKGLQPTEQVLSVQRVLAPLDPPNIICVGLNYKAHARESNLPIPPTPVLFMKPTTSLAHPNEPIRIPASSGEEAQVDYEVELAVVVAGPDGQPVRDVSEEQALECVFGYTVANDVSERWWQKNNGGQWVRGKSFDTFCPLGPALVTRDEIPDPQNLRLRTILNGRVMQESSTSDMIFSVAQLVSFISQDTTLLPGTVILTGTPPGVGFARRPPVFLKPGDVVTVEIEGIGSLTNPVEAG